MMRLRHTCVIIEHGEIWCGGDNYHYQLGNSSVWQTDGYSTIEAVKADPDGYMENRTALSISSSYGTNCAVLDNGSLLCWGYNGRGEVGVGYSQPNGDQRIGVGYPDLGQDRSARAVSMGGAGG